MQPAPSSTVSNTESDLEREVTLSEAVEDMAQYCKNALQRKRGELLQNYAGVRAEIHQTSHRLQAELKDRRLTLQEDITANAKFAKKLMTQEHRLSRSIIGECHSNLKRLGTIDWSHVDANFILESNLNDVKKLELAQKLQSKSYQLDFRKEGYEKTRAALESVTKLTESPLDPDN